MAESVSFLPDSLDSAEKWAVQAFTIDTLEKFEQFLNEMLYLPNLDINQVVHIVKLMEADVNVIHKIEGLNVVVQLLDSIVQYINLAGLLSDIKRKQIITSDIVLEKVTGTSDSEKLLDIISQDKAHQINPNIEVQEQQNQNPKVQENQKDISEKENGKKVEKERKRKKKSSSSEFLGKIVEVEKNKKNKGKVVKEKVTKKEKKKVQKDTSC